VRFHEKAGPFKQIHSQLVIFSRRPLGDVLDSLVAELVYNLDRPHRRAPWL